VKMRDEALVLAALLTGALSPLLAQEPVQAPDTTAQGYSPPAPAPAAVPYTPPASTTAPAPAAPAARRSVAEAMGFIDVLPTRSADRIRNDLESAKADEREADARLSDASAQRSQTKAMVEVKKQEISTLKARIKLAEKQKQESDKIALQAEQKVAERQKQFLERREALHGSEIDQAKAAKKQAQAAQTALQLEQQLAGRRADRAQGAGVDPAATLRQDEVIRELERKTLEAQRSQAEAANDVASRDQDIAKRRLELYQAQMAAGGRN
jgi:hypothetical protein